jgi:polyisoprenoid-binding protein YceI
MRMILALAATMSLAAVLPARAEPQTYKLDTMHTYVSFAAPHVQAISWWRGKFDRTQSGTVTLDPAAKTGSIEVVIDATSIDTGDEALNEHIRSPDFLDAKQYPTATFKSTSLAFSGGRPVSAHGDLTLHGVTHPVTLRIDEFKCIPDFMMKGMQRCGADATAVIDRTQWGVNAYASMTGKEVRLAIQVEGLTRAAGSAGAKQ